MTITWNPDDKNANITLSNGDLTATAVGTAHKAVRATGGKNSGKWYWEYTIIVGGNQYHGIGLSTAILNSYCGAGSDSWGYGLDSYTYHSGVGTDRGVSYTTNDVIGVALDLDNGKIWWSKNGVWLNSGDPAAGTNECYSGVLGEIYPMASLFTSTTSVTANFGASTFTYDVPDGFSSLGYIGYFSGYVYELGSPVERTLFLHNRSDGSLISTTTSSGNGYYYLTTTNSGSHYIVALDDESGESYNDLIIGNVYPTTVSG